MLNSCETNGYNLLHSGGTHGYNMFNILMNNIVWTTNEIGNHYAFYGLAECFVGI